MLDTSRLLLCLICLCIIKGTGSIKLLRVVVPPYRVRGDQAVLECHYELEGDSLYAVKWYKDNEEFYRYVPKSLPPVFSYKLEGVKVDHESSDSRHVTLRAVTLKSSGMYRCEVSAEAPFFSSAQKEGRMEVVFLPKTGPHITGEQLDYQTGDELNLNCTSARSYPPSVLKWFVNDNLLSDIIHISLDPSTFSNLSEQVNILVSLAGTEGSPYHHIVTADLLPISDSISHNLWCVEYSASSKGSSYKVTDKSLIVYQPHFTMHGLATSMLGLRMTIKNDHFVNGGIKVRCIATVAPLLWVGDKESVLQKIDRREALLLVKAVNGVTNGVDMMISSLPLISFLIIFLLCILKFMD